MKKYVFVTPQNDGEAVEIIKLLQESNQEYYTTAQQWGASWAALEDNILKELRRRYTEEDIEIVGVELSGDIEIPHTNIDHHKYENDDRSNDKSSLEQIAEMLQIKLTDYQKAVSLNDKGYIDLMKLNGVDEETIQLVRLQDRAAQGITELQEKQAEKAIADAAAFKNIDLVVLCCEHAKTACITDRLHGKYANILIFSENENEINFFGNGKVIEELQAVAGGWSGGQLPESGYWGICYNDNDDDTPLFIKGYIMGSLNRIK